jgi:hypothetical protein
MLSCLVAHTKRMHAASSTLHSLMTPIVRSRSHNFTPRTSTSFNKKEDKDYNNSSKMQKEQRRRRPMMPITTACTACAQYGSGDASDASSQTGQGDKIIKDWKCAITTSDNQEECQAFPLEVSQCACVHK